ncbi:MAG TPA: iron chelate uptake ABC transporter family permease subunit [Candidatus Blautia gallistercoris]|uniref:Iron chelate uptake ABC transporter family permease subunit n=1 Tax=Candidatus Blautia gallistercoris TaxID=2838490 RepID=A0A9D1WGV2_9FIRM|nr:iron chelate uptake ABC transporter family permease subunit [Candidatus Blautia gallistercoris]
MKENGKKGILILAILGCILCIYVCTILGAASVSLDQINRILLHEIFRLPVSMEGISEGSIAIIRDVRLPRVLLGFLTGASLAVCGACYQGIFKNPMADPYILGISSGAALGAAVGIVLHFSGGILGLSGNTFLAFIGALLTVFLVYTISRVGKRVPVASLLLSGIAVNQSLSAFMSLLMLFNQQSMEQIMFWTMGSLNGKGWNQILVILPYVTVGVILLLTSARELDLMLMGEDTAVQLGVNVEFVKKKILVVSSIVTAAVVSATGIIGFVGLLVPHVVRLFTGPKHRVLMPVSLLFGGTFLILCDTFARSIITQEIPVGIVTAACGGPFFLYLLWKSRRGGTA